MAKRVDAVQADVMARLKADVAEYVRKNTNLGPKGEKLVNEPSVQWVEKKVGQYLDLAAVTRAFAEDAIEAVTKESGKK